MEARYEQRIRNCKNNDELAEYLLDCIPVLRDYTAVGSNIRRGDIYKTYMNDVEHIFESTPKPIEDHSTPCVRCGKQYTVFFQESLSENICHHCGETSYVLGENFGYKEEQEYEHKIVYSYKRENHFNEWISQFQAKESTSVPMDVIDLLKIEFKKQKIKILSDITHEKVKGLLKKLGYAKYYEHVPYITTMISGVTPPTMPPALEAKLRRLFHLIQTPFEKHKPANRKNFLSYSFTLYKLCQLLDEDSYLPCFPLLKSREKLYIQDQIWKKMCQELKFEFIATC